MFKNMKLGTKIAVGFTLLVAVAVTLGGLAVWSMKGVETQSNMLAKEYVPEVDLCNNVERNSLMTMYEMRGYGLTEDKAFYDRGMKYLQEVDNWLTKCEQLAKEAKNLTKLGPAVKETQAAVGSYKDLVQQTVDLNAKLDINRSNLDEAAAKYMSNCAEFLEGQNKAFQKDLTERQTKIELVTDIVAIGTKTRVLNFKSQALGDPKLMEQAIENLANAFKKTQALRPITHDAEDIRRIDQTESSARGYTKAMEGFLAEYKKGQAADQKVLDQWRAEMDKNAGVYVTCCEEFLNKQQEALTEDMTERQQKINLAQTIVSVGNETRIACFKSQALRDPAIIREANANFDQMKDLFADLRKITRLKVDLERIDNTEQAGNHYKTAMNNLLTNWLAREETSRRRGEAADVVLAQAQDTAAAGMEGALEVADGAAGALSLASTTMIIGLGVAVALSIVMAVFITRSITGPIHRIISGLTAGSDQTASASGEVSSASQSLAQGASEQAAAVEETSSSVEEMTSMIRQNAANAQEAKNISASAKGSAEKGTEAMGRMSKAIDDIKNSSDETAKIIKTIDDIAFQTNLLALNAAVEAARAGEAGKGFAVVAEEVRNLAMRSAEAAKNTANMIEEAVKNSDNGVAISQEVGSALSEIAEGSRKVNDLVTEIAAASEEQAQGIEQINQAVTQMDQVVQNNAANAEESASAAEELSAQAEELAHMVEELQNMVGGSHKVQSGPTQSKGGSGQGGGKSEFKPSTAQKQPSSQGKPKSKANTSGGEVEEDFPMQDEEQLAKF